MDNDWKKIKIDGIVSIDKVVAEFQIEEFNFVPYGKFKVRIFENQNGRYRGYTDLMVKEKDGYPSPEVGIGDTIEKALEDTINVFLAQLRKRSAEKGGLVLEDFEYAEFSDF